MCILHNKIALQHEEHYASCNDCCASLVIQTGPVAFQKAGTWYNYLTGETFIAKGSAQNFTLKQGEYNLYLNRNLSAGNSTPANVIAINKYGLGITIYPNPVVNNQFNLKYFIPEAG